MPDDVLSADKATQDRWVFQAAAYWPDVARGGPYDQPTWHYINKPLFLDPADEVLAPRLKFNPSHGFPTPGLLENINIVQAIRFHKVHVTNASQSDKALSYSWLFHLVGDIHQPLHTVSLVSVNRFPEGDRGGNLIPLSRGRNLHAFWDGLLGRRDRMRDIDREVAQLSDRTRYGEVWDTAAKETEVDRWVLEGNAVCKSAVYSPAILDAIRNTPAGEELKPITLPESYMQETGAIARKRIIAAGVRLGELLKTL
jgi:hypothetical protein